MDNQKNKRSRIEDRLDSIDERLKKIETKPIRKHGIVSVFRFPYTQFKDEEFYDGNLFIKQLKENFIDFKIDNDIAEFVRLLNFELEVDTCLGKFTDYNYEFEVVVYIASKHYNIFNNRIEYYLKSNLKDKRK